MIRFLDWLCGLFERAPEPPPVAQPPIPPPIPARAQRPPDRGSLYDPESQAEVAKLESLVHQQVVRNERVSMQSLAQGQRAISAEEQSRSMLDDLMRAMDRGC